MPANSGTAVLVRRRALIYGALLAGAVFFLFPLVWMLSTSLKPLDQTMRMPPTWIPYGYQVERGGQMVWVNPAGALPDQGGVRVVAEQTGEAFEVPISQLHKRVRLRWENFGQAIHAMKYFPLYLRNTLLLCLLNVVGAVFSSALAAYGFSRINWRGRNRVFLLVLATMMIPFPVTMVPLYGLFRWLGWIGTLQPLWVGSFTAGAFNIFLLRQFFMTVPKDLSDAARIDGCSEFRVFWQIILPLCRPALAVVALFTFMGTWNDFLGPLIYLSDPHDFTLALGLQFFQSQHGGTEWHYLMAAGTLISLPIILLYFFAQRTFIEGISMTGVKG